MSQVRHKLDAGVRQRQPVEQDNALGLRDGWRRLGAAAREPQEADPKDAHVYKRFHAINPQGVKETVSPPARVASAWSVGRSELATKVKK